MQRTLQCNGLFQTPRLLWGASDQTICGLRTVRLRVHSAATISQNDQLHWNVPDPCEGLVGETSGSYASFCHGNGSHFGARPQ